MSIKVCCCLCYITCYNYKFLQNENGESTGFYDITVKYFDPIMILTDDSKSAKAICNECWTHIQDFHTFQQTVLKTRALLSGVPPDDQDEEMVELPTESKEFLSEDDFSEKEPLDFDSDADDVPLTKLCKNEKLVSPDKVSLRVSTPRKSCRNVISNKERDFDNSKEHSEAAMQNNDLNTRVSVRKSSSPENDTDIPFKLKEESLTDDELATSVRLNIEQCILKEENEVVDVSNIPIGSSIVDGGAPAKKRRGRKPKRKLKDEENNSRKLHRCSAGDKKSISNKKKKNSNIPKKLKDPNKKSYMDKCKENDTFIAKWKPNLDCDLCSVTATNFNVLRDHFRDVHNTRCYIKCCDRKFYRRCVLMDHISLHINPETHKCDICGKSSTTKHNLKLHKQVMHGDLKQFECEVCHRLFNQKPTLDRHLLTHVKGENKFFCKECDKGYVLEIQLNSHIKTVHGVDCVCDQCGRTFHGANALKKHLMDHSGVPRRKYPCDICGAELNTNNNLRRHKAAYHHDGSTAYICSVCGKVSSSENALRAHKKRVHEENRKHKCTYCEKAFKRPKDLREHVATHTGVDLYQCPHCPQTFKVSANMHHHRKRAHPVEWEEARRNRLQLPKVNIMEVTNQVIL